MHPKVLEKKLKYTFKQPRLLHQALCHSSYVNEHGLSPIEDNERLEFLGDAVVNLVAGHVLMRRFPEMAEGDLSRLRAGLINESTLAEIARRLELGRFIQLGKGESQTGGHDKSSILANAFEALAAALYLDGGFECAFGIIARQFSIVIETSEQRQSTCDFKTNLQEYVQQRQMASPLYVITGSRGPDHNKVFTVKLSLNDQRTLGRGRSKKLAEQDAARRMLDLLADG